MHRTTRPRSFIALLLTAIIVATLAPLPATPAQAQPAAPRVAYVYYTDFTSRDSFRDLLVSRGFAVDLVPLIGAGSAETFDFGPDQAIIIGNDTGGNGPFTWLGSAAAMANIRRAEKYIISIGYGAQYFDAHGGLDIGWGPSWVSGAASAYAVNPGAAAWNTPYPVPVAADTSVKLYGLTTPMLAVYNPTPNTVIRIAREIADATQTHYPIAAQPWTGQFGPVCRLQWGFRRAPNAMTSAGRDAFINLVTAPPCGQAVSEVDVEISKTANTDAATVGQPLTYTLTVKNNSRVTAPSVKVQDTLPPDVAFVSATPSQGTCLYAAGAVTCELGDIPGGGVATIVIVVKPTEAGDLINTAKVSAKALDPNPANNTATVKGVANQPPTFKPIFAFPLKPVFTGQIPFLPIEDLSIFGIEVTQGIQCFNTGSGLAGCADNSMPLLTKKDATARIYLRYSGPLVAKNNVKVRLYITDANNVLYTADATARALPAINQASASDSANIYFNVNFNNNTTVKFHAIVDPDNALSELNESNNRFPAAGDVTLGFDKRKTMKIVGQRLRYHPSGYGGAQYAGGWAVNGGAADYFEQLLPIPNNGVNYVVNSGYLDWTKSMSSDGQHDLIKYLNAQWILQNVFSWLFGTGAFTGARHVYGWVPAGSGLGGHADMPVYPHAGGYGVVAIGNDSPGVSTDNPGSGAFIFAHELVHDYNFKHTDTPDACGSSDDTSPWPYANSSIQEFGFNPFTGKVYDPATTHDVLSYCPANGTKQGWMAPFTWQGMFNKLSPSYLAQTPNPVGGPVLVVNATLNNPALGMDSGQLGDMFKVDTEAPLVLPEPGDYSIQLRDAANAVLATHPFTLTFQSEYSSHDGPHPGDPTPRPTASTVMVVPWVEGTASIALLHNATLLDTQPVSANAPIVQITSPNAAVSWPAGSTQALTWTGSDADGDALSYSVFYSHNGVDWALLATGLTGTTYAVDVDSMAGSTNARFRVVATDGVLTGDDETNYPITIPDKPPAPVITNPGNGTILPFGDLVVMQGIASDLEDGTLPEVSLAWSSDVQGALGTGSSLPVAGLQPGYHNITLAATDSNGNTGQATVRIYIGSLSHLPIIAK